MWKIYANISLISLGSVASLSAQGTFAPVAPAPPAAPTSSAPLAQAAPAQAGMSAPTSGMLESNTFLEMSNRVFDPSSDSMDFENGSYVWKGRNFNLTEQRVFRARLERFLLSSPNEDELQYSALMDEILNRLSVINDNNDETILETWEMLFRAAEFDSDGGNSVIVANQVFNAWRIRKETRGSVLSTKELEDLRKYQQEVVANRERMLQKFRDMRLRESGVARSRESNQSSGGASAGLVGEEAFRALDLAETEAKIIALEAQAVMTGIQAKLQFQSQIVNFLVQRRFQHALVLSGFYQLLFKGSQQQLEVGKDDLKQFFPGSDLTFTVDTMAYVAREAINDVEGGTKAVNAAYDEGRQMIALERIQETFFLGEFIPAINSIPVKQRRDLLDLYRGMYEAGELANAKDYNGVAELAEQLSQLAGDFPKNRVISAVETAKSMSDMAVFAASQYRNLGQIDRAREELQLAIEVWPSNPAIREFQQETSRLATAGSQGAQVFDDLYARGEQRAIYERRMELGFALNDDTTRQPLLMDIVQRIARVDLLLVQSEELLKQSEAYAAWELLAEAATIDPDDGPMNRARAELAPRVADFVQRLDEAERRSKAGHSAAALASYLAAQDIYPASRYCREGIERESVKLLEAQRLVELPNGG
ncbi:MAG: hypothetical protein AAGC73_00875 [Verrucomicrobiota bacterium]